MTTIKSFTTNSMNNTEILNNNTKDGSFTYDKKFYSQQILFFDELPFKRMLEYVVSKILLIYLK